MCRNPLTSLEWAVLLLHTVDFDILWHRNKGGQLEKEQRHVSTRQHIQWCDIWCRSQAVWCVKDLTSSSCELRVWSSCSSLESIYSFKTAESHFYSRPLIRGSLQMVVLLKLSSGRLTVSRTGMIINICVHLAFSAESFLPLSPRFGSDHAFFLLFGCFYKPRCIWRALTHHQMSQNFLSDIK